MAPSGAFCKPQKPAARPTSSRRHRKLSFAFVYQRKPPMRVGSARALLLTYPDRYTRRICPSRMVGRFLDPEATINTVRKKALNPADQHVGRRAPLFLVARAKKLQSSSESEQKSQ